ncbi:MAG: hypothetical protein AUJ92_16895 [Armatimonadetes bacterium CG2_30_59_28]|nr:type 4a pilus biogenesis protein PilO [Armatimonadota bacterium]OIO91295.1 MAG: hypothetical protein AUJ92_16895 [Armatimonadetes bacterium CG2_30_59_28]PIU65871.1 MAG: hypothetical protein COS85_07095 [Armatimonadetes bacterium CG07_land_8_20_14_0_80_59_28]PIX39170.1 MAG: hypothetical protein COZ56_18430 [Armatimonadetes bacterium CG_4_8_14_3_um_filter_58_9]PIY47201.1 MAG: hypothetical protein COZ05_05110 [Armatimonadetes bacterium CG_4_10_14_3_um_filter_59_10]PJB72024.1 MAG: hypothetical 
MVKRQKTLIITCLVSVIMAVVYMSVVNPMWSEWNEVSRKTARRQREVSRLQRKVDQQRGAPQSLGAQETASRWRMTDAQHTAFLTDRMASLCKQAGMKLESLQPASVVKEETHRTHPVRVNVRGDIQRVVDLLVLINALDGAVEVRELSLHREGKGREIGLEMVVATFGQK